MSEPAIDYWRLKMELNKRIDNYKKIHTFGLRISIEKDIRELDLIGIDIREEKARFKRICEEEEEKELYP